LYCVFDIPLSRQDPVCHVCVDFCRSQKTGENRQIERLKDLIAENFRLNPSIMLIWINLVNETSKIASALPVSTLLAVFVDISTCKTLD
jgi:hypothetical protein